MKPIRKKIEHTDDVPSVNGVPLPKNAAFMLMVVPCEDGTVDVGCVGNNEMMAEIEMAQWLFQYASDFLNDVIAETSRQN